MRCLFKFPPILLILIMIAIAVMGSAQSAKDTFGGVPVQIQNSTNVPADGGELPVGGGMGGGFTGAVQAVPGLNIRTSPWGTIIGSFANGAKVTVIAREGDWFKVSYNGRTAYCHADYIKASAASPATETSTGVVNAYPGLNIRTGPWGAIIGSFNNGARVTILGREGDWYKISYNGRTAYCHADFINKTAASSSPAPSSWTGTVNAQPALNARSGPWGNILTSFPNGTRLTIVGKEGEWYKVSWNGRTVYCHSAYISSSSAASSTPASPGTSTSGANGKKVLNVPKQCQGNVSCPYPWSACGPTSLGMALAFYGKGNAGSLASSLWYKCGSTGSAGTPHAGMLAGARAYGFPNAKWHYGMDLSWIRQQISAGKPVIANVTNHYVVITGVDDHGNIYYNDPAKSQVSMVKSYASFSAWWNGGGCHHAAMTLN